jgi:hypothetical protein
MKFELTAKDQLSLESLVNDLMEVLTKREELAKEGPIIAPQHGPGSFFYRLEIRESTYWIRDFMKRLENAKNNRTKEEKESDAKDILESGWKEKLSI